MPQPNGILQSNLPGYAIGDYEDLTAGPRPGPQPVLDYNALGRPVPIDSTGVLDGQSLFFSSTLREWVPGNSTASPNLIIDLNSGGPHNVNSTGVTNGQTLFYDSTSGNWLPGSVLISLNTPNSFTANQVYSPTQTNVNSIVLNVPDLNGSSAIAGLYIADTTGNANGSKLARYDHSGNGVDSGGNPSYGIEMRNFAGAGPAFAIHDYSNATTGAATSCIWDVTTNHSFLLMRNAQNSAESPGSHGTGAYFQMNGYFVYGSTYTDGVVSGTSLASASATFTAEDAGVVGKGILVGGVHTSIAAFVDANHVTLGTAPGDGSSVTFSYDPEPQEMAALSNTLTWTNYSGGAGVGTPFTFTTAAAASAALVINQPSGGSASGYALKITQATAANGINLAQTGAATALVITQSQPNTLASFTQNGAAPGMLITMGAGASGSYGLSLSGQNYGASITTNSSVTGITLSVTQSNSSQTGNVLVINNSGTGDALNVASGGATIYRVNSTGVSWFGAGPVAQQSTTGTTTGMTAGSGTAVLAGSTFTGGSGSTAYTIGDIVLALKHYALAEVVIKVELHRLTYAAELIARDEKGHIVGEPGVHAMQNPDGTQGPLVLYPHQLAELPARVRQMIADAEKQMNAQPEPEPANRAQRRARNRSAKAPAAPKTRK